MEYVIIGACIVVAIAGGIVLYVKNKRTKNELGNTAVVVSKTSSSKLQASEVANDPVIQIGILPADAISDETKLVEITDSKVLAHINNLVPGLAQAGNAANNATQAVKANGEVLYRAIIPAGAKLTDSKAMEGAVRGFYHGADGIRGHANLVAVEAQKGTAVAAMGVNEFINGRSISITRDNPNDPIHLGKEISLKIYDRQEIALGQSRYQIVQQPKFKTKSPILNSRRGDLMLLINGMPVIHLELKRSGIPVSEAYNQIEKYSHEGVFRGIFSLVQIFVAMQPKESVYFANPGEKGVFNKAFYFHWADFNNNPINEWYTFIKKFLSIPMAHMLIGFYTIADTDEGILKVMRSYQYYAAVGIANIVAEKKSHWDDKKQLGGHVWHTTGSGKTMTSFKAAQLVAANHDADKVVFLVDRKELGIQSLKEYRSFATGTESVQATENTDVLISKLKSPDSDNTLIVTSIQKLSNIAREDVANIEADLKIIQRKRMVIIIDECHRSTFGDMLVDIKNTFKNALIFGFTGTPIQDLNAKKDSTTPTIFGDEIHRYTLGDGIRDKNVLGFDPYMVRIYDDADIREKVALSKAKAKDQADAFSDPKKEKVYLKYMDSSQIKMHGELVNGKYVKGIEDFVPNEQYQTDEYVDGVIQDIKKKWTLYSRNRKFHAIFATSSIPEAVKYYRLMVKAFPDLFITAMFDPKGNYADYMTTEPINCNEEL